MNNKLDDSKIASLVQQVEHGIPAELQLSVKHELKKMDRKIHLKNRRRRWYLPLATAAALVFLVSIALIPPLVGTGDTTLPISEIKTELELSGTNIKIIWVQKPEFELKRSEP